MIASLICLSLKWNRGLQRLLCLCALLCASVGYAGQQSDPWGLVDSFPADIDVVAVMVNPAEQLLSDEGRASRAFVGSMGMFGKSQRAWDALGELFGTDADGVIGELLSGRVVVLVDSLFEHSSNPLKLVYMADTNWVVMAEVDDSVLNRLRKKLKPVARDIVSGVAVYGIESGRYALVMLQGEGDQKARVMLSPKGGRGLLERALEAVLEGPKGIENGATPRWTGEDGWSIAVRVRVEGLFDAATGEHVRLFAGESDSGFEMSLAMPFDGEIEVGGAPVGLLGGLDEDIVIAMAASSVFRMVVDEDKSVSVGLRGGEDASGTVLIPDGSLFVFSKEDTAKLGDGKAMGATVLSVFEPGLVDAGSMDALIELFVFDGGDGTVAIGTGSGGIGGSYGGLFPKAVRSHAMVDEDGVVTNVSWLTSERSKTSDLIFSLATDGVDTGSRVRMLHEAAASLDAIGGGEDGGNSVVVSGFVRVDALLGSLSEMKWLGNVDIVSGMGLVSWEVVRDAGVLRGRVVMEKGLE